MNILAIIQALFVALNPTAHNSLTALIQDGLNVLSSLGVITLSKPLVVDGIFGLTTFAAIKALQDKIGLGFLSAEPFASIEYHLLSAFLSTQKALSSKLGNKIQ